MNFYLMKIFRFFFIIIFSLYGQTFNVDVASLNASSVGLYEKVEAGLTLSNASYDNPYDPEQIDIRAYFKSPSDSVWEIFAFYDNYSNINKWKVRFAPNEIGEWQFYLLAVNGDSIAQSADYNFTVVNSAYKGWMKVSPENPHYFVYDNGESYYPVGPYYPWGVSNSDNGLGLLEENDGNFFGYWNIMYDLGEIIESMNSGLGKYDQPKCGRIDNIIQWAEQRGMKVMLAIWPHDLLSNTVWAHQWHQNPYNTVCSVNDFYSDSTAWEYQKKQYRYLIARWGYSRALGMWEIVNEINGTDGWANGYTSEATNWVKIVKKYLDENDPFNRPITADQSGGLYWPEGYALVDVPNVHLYETSWDAGFPGNPLRSSYYVYRKVARQFWNDFEKPGIFGEAGYTNTFGDFEVPSPEYTEQFHNAQWASWSSGLAATPLWWSFENRNMMSPDLTAHYKYFAMIVKNYDYAHKQLQDVSAGGEEVDAFAMKSERDGFGWLREIWGETPSGKMVKINGLADTSYYFHWYDTWTGKKITTTVQLSRNGVMEIIIPEFGNNRADAAFFFEIAEEGEEADLLEISTDKRSILNLSTMQAAITCYVKDSTGRFVSKGDHQVSFSLEGVGTLVGVNPVMPEKAVAKINFQPDEYIGNVKIVASSPGLLSDSVNINVTNIIPVDDFDSYTSDSDLQYHWKTRSGTAAVIGLTKIFRNSGVNGLVINYMIGDPEPPYAGIFTNLFDDLSGTEFLHFWMKPDGSGRQLAILLHEESTRYWQYDLTISDVNSGLRDISLGEFYTSDSSTEMNISAIDKISFNILQGSGSMGSGDLYFDDIYFSLPAKIVGIDQHENENLPIDYTLRQNYPNPFNPETTIVFSVPQAQIVKLAVYNISGQLVKELLNGWTSAGSHKLTWNAVDFASGLYFYRIEASDYTAVRKCIILK